MLPLSDYFIMHFGSEKRKLKSYMKRFFFKGPLSEVIVYYNEIGYHLGGSVFIVTGANSSIGKLLISLLESRKALVVKIVKSSKTLGENEHQCDLSDPKQVLDFCNKFKEKHSKLNGIINLASGLYETYESHSGYSFFLGAITTTKDADNQHDSIENSVSPCVSTSTTGRRSFFT